MGRGEQLFAATLSWLIIACVAVALRFFVRVKLVKTFGIDDYLLLLALGLFGVFCACIFVSVHYGLGKHINEVPLEHIRLALKYQIVGKLIYFLDTTVAKLSVAMLLLRISTKPIYKYIIWGLMGALTIWSFITFCIVLFQCHPVSLAWERIGANRFEGSCLSNKTIVNAVYAFSAMDILCDWVLALLPIPMLWNAHLTRQVRWSIYFVLSLGAFASVACIVRLAYLVYVENLRDTLYEFVPTLLWTTVELGLTLTTASIAAMRPLFKALRLPGFSTRSQSDRPTGPSGHCEAGLYNSHSMARISSPLQAQQKEKSNSGTETGNDRASDDSQDPILLIEGQRLARTGRGSVPGGEKIQVKSEVTIQTETRDEVESVSMTPSTGGERRERWGRHGDVLLA